MGDWVLAANAVDGVAVYERQSGHLVWKIETVNGAEGGVEVVKAKTGDEIYFGSGDGYLRSVQLKTGKVNWAIPTRAELLAPPSHENGVVYFQTGADVVYAVESANGKLLWTYNRQISGNLSVRATTQPTIVGDKVLIGFSDGYFAALKKSDGTLVWEKKLGRGNRFRDIDSTPLVDNGIAYTASFDGTVAAIKAETGDIIWQADAGSSQPPVLGSGTYSDRIYLATDDGALVEFDKETGKRLREFKTSSGGVLSKPSQFQKLIFFGDSNGAVRGLDLESFKPIVEYNTGHGTLATPTVDKLKSELWVLSNSADLYSLRIKYTNPSEAFPWVGPQTRSSSRFQQSP